MIDIVKITDMTPAALDAQSEVHIDRYVDMGSEEARMLDEDPDLTKKFFKIGVEAGALRIDSNGRVWGLNKTTEVFYPFHTESVSESGITKLIGFRIAKKASN